MSTKIQFGDETRCLKENVFCQKLLMEKKSLESLEQIFFYRRLNEPNIELNIFFIKNKQRIAK